MGITGTPVLVLSILLAVALPLGTVAFAVALRRRPTGPRRVINAVALWLAVVLCQASAAFAIGIGVNRAYDLFGSWGDVFGVANSGSAGDPPISLPTPTSPTAARLESLMVNGTPPNITQQVVVWLPPHYNELKAHGAKLPVIMYLSAQPGTVGGMLNRLSVAKNSLTAVQKHKIKPFISVVVAINTSNPTRDNECLDKPDRTQLGATWIIHDVRDAIIAHYAASTKGTAWGMVGFSTGGYCAANLMLNHPDLFHAAVSLGGYFAPGWDKHTGPDWFAGQPALQHANSPLWRYQNQPPAHANLLVITSKGDPSSWSGASYANSAQMVPLLSRVPGSSAIVLDTGGHAYNTYNVFVPRVIDWMGGILH